MTGQLTGTGPDLTARTGKLSPERRALVLDLLVARARKQATGIPTLPRDGRRLPLSPMQEELWFLHRLAPESSMYHAPLILRLTGPLDVDRVRAAVTELVARHEVLRTRFVDEDGEPHAVIDPPGPVEVPVLPLARPARLPVRLRQECDRPFDLAREPGLRPALIRMSPTNNVLVLNLHHIVSDEWTEGLLWRDFLACYQDNAAELPELPVQYPDFAAWQRDLLAGPTFDRLAGYWRDQLADAPMLELPTDHPRPPVQRFRGGEHLFPLSAKDDAALRELGRAEGATAYMAHLAVFLLLLSRWSGQHDITIGTITAGRDQRQVRDVAGFFVNALALRTDISGAPTFRELLGRVRRTTLDAHAHQAMPFRTLVETVQPPRAPGRSPLFGVLFTYSPADRDPDLGGLPGITVTRERFELPVARFDLVLNIVDTPTGAAGAIEYDTDLFTAATADEVGEAYRRLLADVVARPDHPLS